ncbi:MAG TPA: vWA domain-containing protein [Verrucomicrobiae bacterium]|nr:vWA domain-containing protein [Verrucomicrobiae bacterium]
MVLAILSSAIGISYATANRGLLSARQAQENSQMTENVQTQIEFLRTLAPLGTNDSTSSAYNAADNIYYPSGAYCLKNLPATPTIETNASNCWFPAGAFQYQLLIYNCNNMPADGHCINTILTTDTFVVEATWPDVTGNGTDTATQAYRVHPPTGIAALSGGGGGSGGGGVCTTGSAHDIVMAFDASGSMGEAGYDGLTRGQNMQTAATIFANSVGLSSSGNHVSIIDFYKVFMVDTLLDTPSSPFSSDQSAAVNAIANKYKPMPVPGQPTTDFNFALLQAKSYLTGGSSRPSPVHKVLVFYSDGGQDVPDTPDADTITEGIADQLKAAGIEIFSINAWQQAAIMENIATPGDYRWAPDTKTLNKAFSDLASTLICTP